MEKLYAFPTKTAITGFPSGQTPIDEKYGRQIKKGHTALNCKAFIYMVPLTRLERVTYGLGIRCSILLSYRGDLGFVQ